MTQTRMYLPVRTFVPDQATPVLSVWSLQTSGVEAPYLLQFTDVCGFDHNWLFDFDRRDEELEFVVFTPLVTTQSQGMEKHLTNRGFAKVEVPLDDPFCGQCRKMCLLKWVYEDVAGDGPAQWAAEAVSDCCRAALLADPCGIVEFDPDPNAHGAFDDDGGIDL